MKFKHFRGARGKILATMAWETDATDPTVVAVSLAVVHPKDAAKASKEEGRMRAKAQLDAGKCITCSDKFIDLIVRGNPNLFVELEKLPILKALLGKPDAF